SASRTEASSIVPGTKTTEPSPVPPIGGTDAVRPQKRTDRRRVVLSADELLEAAREADAEYRASHAGKGITREELRGVLGVGTGRASALVRELRGTADSHRPSHDQLVLSSTSGVQAVVNST